MKRKPLRLILVAGVRPNFMKVAPLLHAIDQYRRTRSKGMPSVECCFVHTGQHYDSKMSDLFFQELGMRAPDINLQVASGSHAVQTGRIAMRFEPVCQRQKPDWVIVVGDGNSTMACALVAAKLGIKLAHVEAGLRSFDRAMPEEINRLVTDTLADLLLTPSSDANENLRREGIAATKIRLVGNIMIDTVVAHLEKSRSSVVAKKVGLSAKEFAYVTLHRPSNVDDPKRLKAIMSKLTDVARRFPVIFPVHPRTRKVLASLARAQARPRNLKLIGPVGYHDSLWFTENAKFVLTDSGGLQEESTYLQTPCLTLRANTERPVTIEIGTNQLTSIDRLTADIDDILHHRRRPGRIPPLWDGGTAQRVIRALLEYPLACETNESSADEGDGSLRAALWGANRKQDTRPFAA
jgi:UDP-N-acetylglucosamine 2-epimerase (non-hydrolysing)